MKTRTSSYRVALAVITAASLVIDARSEPVKTTVDSSADKAVNETRQADTGQPPTAPVQASGVKKAAQQTKFSFGVEEVAKMYQSGVETDVILNYIESSNVPYHPSAEEIVRLHDLGVPSQIITTLIRHGAQVQRQAAVAYAQSQQKATEEAKAASAYANTYSAPVYSAPPPTVTYNYSYPQYAYTGYPAYVYSGYYSYPRYCYSSPFYSRYCYPHRFYSYGGFGCYPHFGFGATFGHSSRFRVGVRF